MASGSAVSDPSLNGVSSTPGENEYPSGFPQSICDEVPKEKYLCSNCNNVLNKARQTVCGHRYCLACVNWLDHQSQCEYALIPCNIGCGLMVQRKSLATHLEGGCPNNKTTCPSCSGVLTLRELQKHVCPNSGDKKTTKTDKRQKNNHPGSSKKKEPCIFSDVGCPFKGNADKVKEHESCSHVGHLQLLLDVTRALQRTLNSSAEQSHHESPDLLLPGQCGASHIEGEIETDGGDPGVSDKALSLHDDQAELAVGQQLDALQQRVQVMENIISALNREVEKTQISVLVLERDNYNSQHLIQHLETKVAEQLQRLVRKDIHITSLQQCISAQQDISYDGTFLWRLCDVSQKLREAATGQKISQYSPGIKAHISPSCAISIFRDLPLTSPARAWQVTFFLIDQNQREHVIDAFRPDLSSASFHCPVSEMNVASGCPLFFPLGKLKSPKHAYCNDDTIYIKCVVDISS
ncbi:TNF receptor-associated factor 1-like [Sinocyclocheilus rhinocerous]|uniref:TNF receptor-associated factor 1-like n=1 Tax=Sinocyclocheilus rhinocerous TaxID=307959 RepID=UPI0007B8BDA6|nr:PREDICTED: TNF receptor-associated factor 1-like [Sinocyclocheilus rhinocerous]